MLLLLIMGTDLISQNCTSDNLPDELEEGFSNYGDTWFQMPFCDEYTNTVRMTTGYYEISNPNYDPQSGSSQETQHVDAVFYTFVINSRYDIHSVRLDFPDNDNDGLYDQVDIVAKFPDETLNLPNESEPVNANVVVVRVVKKSFPALDTEECIFFVPLEMEFEVSLVRHWGSFPDFRIDYYIGRMTDPFDENEFTLSNFQAMDYKGGAKKSKQNPSFKHHRMILADGESSPVNLSTLISFQVGTGDVNIGELPHFDVACNGVIGDGYTNDLHVLGTLIVDTDYCFINDHSIGSYKHEWSLPRSGPSPGQLTRFIYLDPDAKIVIQSGATLTLQGTILISCNTLWNSIVVEDGGTLNIRESYIRDGIHAIHVEEGGTVNIERNIFDGNFVSFYTPPNQGSGRYAINMGPFYGNEFIDESGLHQFPDGYVGIEQEVPFAAIQVNDLVNFTAGGVGQAGQVEPNTIEDIPYGIYANHSSVFIQNYSISNAYFHEVEGKKPFGGIGILLKQKSLIPSEIIGNGKTSGVPNISNAEIAGIDAVNGFNQIRDNVVVDTEIGVRLNQTRLSIHALIENYIESKNYGIFHQTVAGGFTNILNNEILMRNTAAPPSGEFNYGIALHGFGYTGAGGRLIENNQITLLNNSHKGVYSNSVSHLRIRENNIEDQEDNNEFMGIGINNSPFSLIDYNTTGGSVLTSKVSTGLLLRSSHSTRINCNVTENSLYGIQVVEGNEASELKGNLIGTHQHFGLLYGYGPTTNQTEPHLTGIQRHHGNIWSECYETTSCNLGGLHTNRPDIVEQSEFFVDPTNSQFTTTRDPHDWFKEEPESVTWTCPEERPESPWYDFTPESNPTEWDEKLVLDFDVFDDNPYFESWRSISERNLFERIMMGEYESSALNSPVLDSFMQKHEYSNISVLYNVRQTMASALDLTEAQWMEVEDKVDSIYIEVAALFELDSLAWADTTSVDTAQWLSDRAQIQESIHIIQSNLDSYAEIHSTDIEGVSNQVQSTLGTLTAQTPPEAYEIEMLELISATVFQAEWDFTAQERTIIENTADLCPSFGGPAVFWARNLRESFDPGTVYNDTLCTEQWGERIMRDIEEQGSSVLVFPNPATDEIKVDFSGLDFDRWGIYSMDGRRVNNGKVTAEEFFSINTSDLRTGIYLLRLSRPDSSESIPFNIQRIGQ
ncbi:MAG: T9SS C-terminal target domain-containing protein [Saprospirales bacterium]|nr:MAG: T9SS C-terminal target domain-containing protein [Saprospirales bacterium]